MPAWHGILWCPACHLTTSMDVASMAPSPVCVFKKALGAVELRRDNAKCWLDRGLDWTQVVDGRFGSDGYCSAEEVQNRTEQDMNGGKPQARRKHKLFYKKENGISFSRGTVSCIVPR
jgi:hypothetical protein